MSYRQLLANLEALPEVERQLAAFQYLLIEEGKEVCGCVLGKGIPDLRALVRKKPSYNRNVGIQAGCFLGIDFGGLALDEAFAAQEENDFVDVGCCGANAPEARRARYRYMIDWLRVRVAEEAATSAASAERSDAPKEVLPLRAGGKEEA